MCTKNHCLPLHEEKNKSPKGFAKSSKTSAIQVAAVSGPHPGFLPLPPQPACGHRDPLAPSARCRQSNHGGLQPSYIDYYPELPPSPRPHPASFPPRPGRRAIPLPLSGCLSSPFFLKQTSLYRSPEDPRSSPHHGLFHRPLMLPAVGGPRRQRSHGTKRQVRLPVTGGTPDLVRRCQQLRFPGRLIQTILPSITFTALPRKTLHLTKTCSPSGRHQGPQLAQSQEQGEPQGHRPSQLRPEAGGREGRGVELSFTACFHGQTARSRRSGRCAHQTGRPGAGDHR